jgi:hypothetical protein
MAGESSKKAGKAAIPIDIDGHNLPPSPAPSSPRNGRKYALMTELVYTESSDQYNASSVPIYQVRYAACWGKRERLINSSRLPSNRSLLQAVVPSMYSLCMCFGRHKLTFSKDMIIHAQGKFIRFVYVV